MRTPAFLISIIALCSFTFSSSAAEPDTVRPFTTFKMTRLNNSHSVETLLPGDLDFRVVHRFGDMAGDQGGIHTLFGIDEARDIRIGVDYGVMEDLTVGFGRSKGAGPVQELYDGFVKYRPLTQREGLPFSLTVLASAAGTIMESNDDASSPVHFEKLSHRFSYFHQILLASRVSDYLSVQLMPSYSHRNLVAFDDENSIFGAGAGFTLNLSKKWGIIGEYHYLFPQDRSINGQEVYNPASFGLELETGGHVFHITVSNSGGIGGNQFLPHTVSDMTEGEFRLGFTISRLFHL